LFDERRLPKDGLQLLKKAITGLNRAGINDKNRMIIPNRLGAFGQVFPKERCPGARGSRQTTAEAAVEKREEVAEVLVGKNPLPFGGPQRQDEKKAEGVSLNAGRTVTEAR